MPEDLSIRRKRLTGFRVVDEVIVITARQRDETFGFDLEKRASQMLGKKQRARITIMKTSIKRRK